MEDAELIGLAMIPVLAAVAQVLAVRIGMPSIVVLLAVGFLAGVPSWGIDPDALLGDTLFPFVALAVAVILFEGGLTLRLGEVRGGAHRHVRRLLTIGIPVTWALTAILVALLLDVSTDLAILMGAILIVSGPTVVGPLLQFIGVRGRTDSVLRWEGILIDPIGAIIAVLCLHALGAGRSFESIASVLGFVVSVSWGALIGVLGGLALVYLLSKARLARSLQAVVTLAAVLGAFAAAGALREDSGYVSVVLMGAILANQSRVATEHIHEFKETIGLLLTGVLFIVLSARITPSQLLEAGPAALLLVVAIILVVRPVAALLATAGGDLSWRERLFISAMAPRGIVAASTASIAAISLAESEVLGLDLIVPTVFIVIVGTVTVYGVVAPMLARAFGMAGAAPPEGSPGLAGLIEEDPRRDDDSEVDTTPR